MMGMGTTPARKAGSDLGPSALHSPFEKEKRNKRRDDGGYGGPGQRGQAPTEGEKNAMVEKFCMVTNATKMAAREYLERSHYDVHQAINLYLAESTGEVGGGNQSRQKPGWFESKK